MSRIDWTRDRHIAWWATPAVMGVVIVRLVILNRFMSSDASSFVAVGLLVLAIAGVCGFRYLARTRMPVAAVDDDTRRRERPAPATPIDHGV